jgi:hypothetical protein
MTEEEVSEKFLRYASCCVETGSARRFAEAVLNGPSDLGMRRLWGLLEHRGAPR